MWDIESWCERPGLSVKYQSHCNKQVVDIARMQNSNKYTHVVVRTDLSSKELHRQAGVYMMVISRSLDGVMVSTLARNARDVGSIHSLGTMFLIFITPTTLVAGTMIPGQAACCMVV